jgi:hypothetical protein
VKTSTALIIGAVLVLGVIFGSQACPRTVTETEILTLPSTPDTVFVQDTIIETKWRIRDVVTTDTLNLTDTVTITIERPVDQLNRLFIDTVTVGQYLGDTTKVATTRIRTDSSGVFRQDELHRLITIGHLRSIAATDSAVEVDFIPFPEPPKSCGFGCKMTWGLGGTAVGVIIGVVFGG